MSGKSPTNGLVAALNTSSRFVARQEKRVAATLAILVFVLVLANIITRLMKVSVFWIDELAIYMMIWMAFLAASAALESREHIAVTLLTDALPARLKMLSALLVDTILVIFGGILLALAWVWFSPLELLQSGFDVSRFSETELNFIYSEPTSALGVPKYLFWLIMPLFSLTVTLHSLNRFAHHFTGLQENSEGEA